MKVYALTVKKTRKPITLALYEDYLTWLSKKVHVGNVNYEDTRGLHIHLVIQSEEEFPYNELKMEKYGWSYKMVPIYNHDGWIHYIEKDTKKDIKLEHMLQELHENDPRTESEVPNIEPEYSEETIEILPNFDIRNIPHS